MTWTRERWQRIESLFHEVALCEPEARAQTLQRECGADIELRAAVEKLLEADAGPDDELIDGGLGAALHGKDPLLHERFGPFRLVERVADGGMGTVYRGERCDGEFTQEVAVKVLRFGLQTNAMRERFARERRTLAALVHPNVARLLDGGTTDGGVPFLAMEFIDGVRCDRYCDEQRLAVRARLALFATVCRAVHFVHQNLVVHLDLKPSNILVDRHGVPKLVDFGVAGLLEANQDGATAVEATRNRPLTPEYASPELLRGERVATAADVYSLGVVLYELLTGVRAFWPARSEVDVVRAVCDTEVGRPSRAFAASESTGESPTAVERAKRRAATPRELVSTLRGDIDRIVAKAVHKDAAQRYASCQDLADDVERWLGGFPVHARGSAFGYRARRFAGRHAFALGAATAVLLALVLGLVATLHMAAVAREERDVADAARRRIAHEVEHARIETSSHRMVAAFLGETFLSGQLAGGPAHRDRLLATIERKARQVRAQQSGNVHLQANLLDALGHACLAIDAFAPAEVLVREAMGLRAAAFGTSSLEYALSLGSLGQLCYRTGQFEAARDALRTSYRLHKECSPDVHTDVAMAANDLAAAERALGDHVRARELHREALALRRAGGDPLLIAESLNNLANAEVDLESARQLLEESHRLREQVLGADDPLTIQSLANRGSLCLSRGDASGAKELLGTAVEHSRALGELGVDGLAVSLRALAYAHLRIGELPAARAAITEALELERQRLGRKHPRVATALEVCAKIDEAAGDWTTATAAWEEVLAIRRATLPPGHRQAGLALLSLGAARALGGAPAEGLSDLDEALDLLARPNETRIADVVDCQRMRSFALVRLGRRFDAEQALHAALRELGEPPADAERAAAVRDQLQRLAQAPGR
jgi:serine/threonine-protein kinase